MSEDQLNRTRPDDHRNGRPFILIGSALLGFLVGGAAVSQANDTLLKAPAYVGVLLGAAAIGAVMFRRTRRLAVTLLLAAILLQGGCVGGVLVTCFSHPKRF
jgi:hypothetical protein